MRENPARWAGSIAPDLALAAATGGAASTRRAGGALGRLDTALPQSAAGASRLLHLPAPPLDADGLHDLVAALPRGRGRRVKLAPSETYLAWLWERAVRGGRPVTHETYDGDRVVLPGGTEVGRRWSEDHDITLDIFDGVKTTKVHINGQ